jgi:hypothetical protein
MAKVSSFASHQEVGLKPSTHFIFFIVFANVFQYDVSTSVSANQDKSPSIGSTLGKIVVVRIRMKH